MWRSGCGARRLPSPVDRPHGGASPPPDGAATATCCSLSRAAPCRRGLCWESPLRQERAVSATAGAGRPRRTARPRWTAAYRETGTAARLQRHRTACTGASARSFCYLSWELAPQRSSSRGVWSLLGPEQWLRSACLGRHSRVPPLSRTHNWTVRLEVTSRFPATTAHKKKKKKLPRGNASSRKPFISHKNEDNDASMYRIAHPNAPDKGNTICRCPGRTSFTGKRRTTRHGVVPRRLPYFFFLVSFVASQETGTV